tara:strand:- start:36 stop:254 length:219 start_codon:yes stop_codon:yes gene_type:complete
MDSDMDIVVRGELYMDLNKNGIREEDEARLPYASVLSSPEEAFGLTHADGSYWVDFYGVAAGTYEIAPFLEN